uniref:Biotin carboxyl carrier protein of acetyl-CoA carboxylase n=1 Tax=Bostrychia tenella TaxID=324755 RepID=A0A1Z1M5K4_9FLOR|nr:acetyl-CoA carboxylase biotin carboxyl carrier protein [Bostrychia tenella]ARW61276.1 acetyl-CoA carboxylase biotin carboxyl carrier protein [Bostrychia tenella]
MVLQLDNIKNFIRSIKKKQITKIIIKNNKTNILINKEKKVCYQYSSNQFYGITNNLKNNHYYNTFQANKHLEKDQLSNKFVSKSITKTKDNSEQSTSYSTIISPMVGTFYRSPAPNEQPFIGKNDIVKPKQTVCIIEAMKLMNEIEAEVNGEIVEILVNDGDIVDCGQALMKVKTKYF